MLPEQISGAGNAGDPESRTEEVEESKRSPAHSQHAGQRPRKNAQSEDEAGKENGGCAVAGKHFLAAFQRGRLNPKESLIAIEQRTPPIVAYDIADVVAERGGTRADHDDPSEMELMFGIGEKTCQQERGFTGDGDAGVLAQQSQGYGPVTVGGDEFAQRMKNREAHELMKQVPSSQFSVLRRAGLTDN